MTDIAEEILNKVADAIEEAKCPHREGPYGLYDYSTYPGDAPPHCVRDFRDPKSDAWGDVIYSTNDPDDARSVYDRLTRQHIALAAITALNSQSER